jgi:hypothetical protein
VLANYRSPDRQIGVESLTEDGIYSKQGNGCWDWDWDWDWDRIGYRGWGLVRRERIRFFFFFVFGWWKEGVDVLLCADGCGGLWCVVVLGDGVGWLVGLVGVVTSGLGHSGRLGIGCGDDDDDDDDVDGTRC